MAPGDRAVDRASLQGIPVNPTEIPPKYANWEHYTNPTVAQTRVLESNDRFVALNVHLELEEPQEFPEDLSKFGEQSEGEEEQEDGGGERE